jgi:hypothetical protein
MSVPEQERYRALRATIRQRGTARVWIFVTGVWVWASLTVATAALAAPPVAALVPLLVLAATFEAVYALHVGVERIGRYLEVFFDDSWESAAMAFGRPAGAAAIDPLFTLVFALAALFNFMPVLVALPSPQEWIFIGGVHALFGVRVVFAKLTASRQRGIDRERFLVLKRDAGHKDAKTQSN